MTMVLLYVRLFLLMCLSVVVTKNQRVLRKEAYQTVPELITSAGYPVEKHRITTEDGYIIQMHRIPAGRRVARKSGGNPKGKKAILILHGLMGSSGDFVIMGPERSLGYLLADAGYDVWLGNLRGNDYTSHKKYDKKDSQFWEFSFHEHGKYDLPAMIDKVLAVTGLSKLMYVGYSMGTTTFFVMASERPEYNDKIISFVALAPAVYVTNNKKIAETALKTLNITDSMRSQGMLALTAPRNVRDAFIRNMCLTTNPEDDVCMRFIYLLVGEDKDQYDKELNSVILARAQPASWRQLEHFGKIGITDVFTSWEDGLWGAVRPYNLSNVKVPVTLLYGLNDRLTDKKQIMRLAKELKATGVLEDVRPACSWPKFNHLDFAFARDLGSLFTKPLITYIRTLFNKYGPS